MENRGIGPPISIVQEGPSHLLIKHLKFGASSPAGAGEENGRGAPGALKGWAGFLESLSW